jgi:lysozyme family protein
MDRFAECHAVTAKWEGGWSNHPDDPGGPTMYGIIQKVYDGKRKEWGKALQSVRLITRVEALRIFREDYWDKVGADTLPAGVDLCGYDGGVNSGVGQSKKWLARSASITDPVTRVKNLCKQRLSMLQSLKSWKSFGKGWTRRVVDIEAKGVAMALAAAGATASEVKSNASSESGLAKARAKTASGQAKLAGVAASGAGGGTATQSNTVTDVTGYDPAMIWVLAAIAMGLGIIALVRFIHSRQEAERAQAYAEVAQ